MEVLPIILFAIATVQCILSCKNWYLRNKYLKINNKHDFTGEELAKSMLNSVYIRDVSIKSKDGRSRYDSMTKTIHINEEVYGSRAMTDLGGVIKVTSLALLHNENPTKFQLRRILGWIVILFPFAWIIFSYLVGDTIFANGQSLSLYTFGFIGVSFLLDAFRTRMDHKTAFSELERLCDRGVFDEEEQEVVSRVLKAGDA